MYTYSWLIITFCVSIIILLLYLLYKYLFTERFNLETHFVSFWGEDRENSIERFKIEFNKLNNAKILYETIIPKDDINNVFKKVSSGGKKHCIDYAHIFIIQVPDIYKKYPTHDNPDGQLVNDYMYKLKVAARGDYKKFKIAHSSFDIEESNDFFNIYNNYCRNYNSIQEFIDTLNMSKKWWLYDRVNVDDLGNDYNLEGNLKDIDLIVEDIPFILKFVNSCTKGNDNKILLNNKHIKLDLQDLNSNYYPKEWLEDIKLNTIKYRDTNIPVPNELNHFMLGLYHLYVHKNGMNMTPQREKSLLNLAENLEIGPDPIRKEIILKFLMDNNYEIKDPINKSFRSYISSVKNYRDAKTVYKTNSSYIYLFKNKNMYHRNKVSLERLKNGGHFPKIIDFNDELFYLEVENTGNVVSKSNLNISSLENQINKIRYELLRAKISHNDINVTNMTIKNRKLYLIDFDHAIDISNIPEWNYSRNDNNNYCKDMPLYRNETNLDEYITNNKCLHRNNAW